MLCWVFATYDSAFRIQCTRLARCEYGELIERLGNLRIERDQSPTGVFHLGADALDIEVGGNTLRATLLGQGQDLLLDLSRITDECNPLLLVT